MTLDEILLERIRGASRDLWRGTGARVSLRLVLVALAAGLWIAGMAWLLGSGRGTERLLDAVAGIGIPFLLITLLSAVLAIAFLDALRALIVQGSLVRSLGDLILRHAAQPGGSRLEDHFAAFATPHQLSRHTRFRDLPLILFLSRMVLSQDPKSLLRMAVTGVGREGLMRELEDQVRAQAAAVIRRRRIAVILLLAVILSIPQLIAWLFR
jgi:hypothetical protein